LTELDRLSQRLGGPRIFMKRDDQTGLAFGGNKTRKLEYLLGDALERGCDTLVTGGAVQSNHCRQTSAAAAACGMSCHLALGGYAPQKWEGNLLLDNILGATIHWCGENRKGETIPDIVADLANKGCKPCLIPYGGSNTIGAAAFVNAAGELRDQLKKTDYEISHIVFASSSGGTHAGLMLGARIFDLNSRIIGIGIDKDEAGDGPYDRLVMNLANETAKRLEVNTTFSREDVIIKNDYLGEGYGVVGELERRAIRLVAETQGVLLDPVYTGRAMGGLLDMIEGGEFSVADRVLFWHTGGSPALFSYSRDLLKFRN
ncbi:MAG: D-cysteine desulfhydrase family protein, partial [bacterium]|nr:D-cysteine desulfhydrase family protein [bacterium]